MHTLRYSLSLRVWERSARLSGTEGMIGYTYIHVIYQEQLPPLVAQFQNSPWSWESAHHQLNPKKNDVLMVVPFKIGRSRLTWFRWLSLHTIRQLYQALSNSFLT